MTEGFQELISRTYTQLKLLGGVTYGEQQVAGAANPDSGLFDAEALMKIDQAAQEVLSAILRKTGQGEQVTMKSIVGTFQAKPYGWDLASIEVIVASLIGASKVTVTMDGNVLKRTEIATALRNTQKHGHQIFAPQKTFDERKVSNFRKFCVDFFDEPSAPKDPVELAHHGADKLKGKLDELRASVIGSRYPFVEQLNVPIGLLEQAVGKSDDWYLNDFDLGDDLLEAKDNVIDPIQSFISGPQRAIYDAAAALLTTHVSNLSFLPPGSDETITTSLADPNAFRGNKMAQLKQAADELRSRIDGVVAEHRETVTSTLERRRSELTDTSYYTDATPEAQQHAVQQIDQTLARIATENQVAVIQQIGSNFESSQYPGLLDLLASSPATPSPDPEPVKQTISVKTVLVPGASGVLETAADVDNYLTALRSALIETLNDGKRISL